MDRLKEYKPYRFYTFVQLWFLGLLDPVTHHCDILETGNDSYRFKQRKKAAEKQ